MEKQMMDETNKEKGRRMWKKVKYQLVEYHSLPAYLKDNEYILRHYRSEWPLKHALLSIFRIHNETLNIWTHLVGFFLFLALTIYTARKMPGVIQKSEMVQKMPSFSSNILTRMVPSLPGVEDLHKLSQDFLLSGNLSSSQPLPLLVLRNMGKGEAITRWPMFAFLGGAMFCLLLSSACHLLSCHSQRVSYIMLRVDYAGIAALICMSLYPPVYYSFMCHPSSLSLYLTSISVLTLTTLPISLLPFFHQPRHRTLRTSLFFSMGLSGSAPILHKLLLFGLHHPPALHTTSLELLMASLYSLGALLYATRFPERLRPGFFDLAGHSHQLFHLLVLAGAFTHYRTALLYLNWRDSDPCISL